MTLSDPTTTQVVGALSTPVAPELLAGPDLSRRRFLQAAGVTGAATLLPGWLAEAAAAATPLRADEGVLVLLTMAGGNDGLNTFVPVADGAYHDARRHLALGAGQTLPLTADRGLNPHLPFLKRLWDRGQVAVIEGVGRHDGDLSHFVSMARIMAANGAGQAGSTGWLGRVLDGYADEPLTGVAMGTTVPLVVQGHRARATAIPHRGNNIRYLNHHQPNSAPQFAFIEAMGVHPSGLGDLGDRVAGGLGHSLDVADSLLPLIDEDEPDEPKVLTELRLAARLINANLGVRVISVLYGDFDSHANQATMHRERMEELDAGLRAFYGTLHPDFADRTLLVGTSEFGRRVRANANGTDHGTANSLFAIGTRVNGGLHGELPSLTALDNHRNLIPTVDFRNLYANLATTWLGADAVEVVGRDWPDLGFLRSPGRAPGDPPPSTPVNAPTIRDRRAEVARLYLAYFLRWPDDEGYEYWVGVRRSGESLAAISAEFAASPEFRQRYGSLTDRQFVDLVYRNVLGRGPDSGGLAHWTGVLERGVSRGDVMVGFSESAEFTGRTTSDVDDIERTGPVGRLYRAYFLRAPDEEGLVYWTNTGLPPAAVSEQFAASAEFTNRYGSLGDRDFVVLAYRNVLGRDADAAGLAHWLDVLRRGTGRGAVMLGFSDSPEFVRHVRSS